MKKTLKALAAISLVIAALFSLCSCSVLATTALVAGKSAIEEETEPVTLIAQENNIVVMTQEDGGLARDEAGNIIAYVTDANGKFEKDKNGEYETTPVDIDRPAVIGRRIEGPTYALTIPDGWSDKLTYTDLDIIRNGTKDNIRLSVENNTDVDTVFEKKSSIITISKNNFPNAESESRSITLANNINAQYAYLWVEDTGVREEDENGNLNAVSSFVGIIVFEHADNVYCCMLSSNNNMNEDLQEIIDILNSIEFM